MARPEVSGTHTHESGRVALDHGTGAKLSGELVSLLTSSLGDVYVGEMEDSAVLPIPGGKIAMTTDSFVVTPIFFKNGDIGKIAVCGTVNDLAVSGARPLYLTLSIVVEVGFPIADLLKITRSVRDTAIEAKVKLVAGDTKVVDRGEVDKIFLNTAGVGTFERAPLSARTIAPGDKVILSSYLGNHSIHILSMREGLGFEDRVASDCAPLNGMIEQVLSSVPAGAVRTMRDVTRGGLSAVMHEYAKASGLTMRIDEASLPILRETAMAADMLGVNPIHLANEGCVCLFVAPEAEEQVLATLRGHQYGRVACTVGVVTPVREPQVFITQSDGTRKLLEELVGAEIPRLC